MLGDLAELARPEVNIHYGVTYLSQAWRLTGGDLCRALMKYRAGHGEEVDVAPVHHLLRPGESAFGGRGLVPFVFFPPPAAKAPHYARRGPPRNRTAAVSHAFWAAHDARVRARDT
jgi:hypothetical protein